MPFRSLYLHCTLKVSHAQRCAVEDSRPEQITYAAGIVCNPAGLELESLGKFCKSVIGQHHLGDGTGHRNLVHIGEAAVQIQIGRLCMYSTTLRKEFHSAVEFFLADNPLPVFIAVTNV